jgi:hypothetical protein
MNVIFPNLPVEPLAGPTTATCLTGTAGRSTWKVEKNAGIEPFDTVHERAAST